MAVIAKLQLGNNDGTGHYDKEYLLSAVKTHFCRSHNTKQPDSAPRCESFSITLPAPGKDDLTLFEWFVDMSLYSGKLLIDNSQVSSNDEHFITEIVFEEAMCLSLSESYDIRSGGRRMLHLEFDAAQITVSDVTFRHL